VDADADMPGHPRDRQRQQGLLPEMRDGVIEQSGQQPRDRLAIPLASPIAVGPATDGPVGLAPRLGQLAAELEAAGYRARAVATAGAALAVDLDRVGLVISDLGLPDLDGRILVEKLKARRDLKAIALSGYGTEADVQASEAAGFDQRLTKPVEMAVLWARSIASARSSRSCARPPSESVG
jgi:CheY-like chemotaxis protein